MRKMVQNQNSTTRRCCSSVLSWFSTSFTGAVFWPHVASWPKPVCGFQDFGSKFIPSRMPSCSLGLWDSIGLFRPTLSRAAFIWEKGRSIMFAIIPGSSAFASICGLTLLSCFIIVRMIMSSASNAETQAESEAIRRNEDSSAHRDGKERIREFQTLARPEATVFTTWTFVTVPLFLVSPFQGLFLGSVKVVLHYGQVEVICNWTLLTILHRPRASITMLDTFSVLTGALVPARTFSTITLAAEGFSVVSIAPAIPAAFSTQPQVPGEAFYRYLVASVNLGRLHCVNSVAARRTAARPRTVMRPVVAAPANSVVTTVKAAPAETSTASWGMLSCFVSVPSASSASDSSLFFVYALPDASIRWSFFSGINGTQGLVSTTVYGELVPEVVQASIGVNTRVRSTLSRSPIDLPQPRVLDSIRGLRSEISFGPFDIFSAISTASVNRFLYRSLAYSMEGHQVRTEDFGFPGASIVSVDSSDSLALSTDAALVISGVSGSLEDSGVGESSITSETDVANSSATSSDGGKDDSDATAYEDADLWIKWLEENELESSASVLLPTLDASKDIVTMGGQELSPAAVVSRDLARLADDDNTYGDYFLVSASASGSGYASNSADLALGGREGSSLNPPVTVFLTSKFKSFSKLSLKSAGKKFGGSIRMGSMKARTKPGEAETQASTPLGTFRKLTKKRPGTTSGRSRPAIPFDMRAD
ncbi:hypothetical protein SCHPADRAFT_446262 [Schizopora paradoxa]|uniref:Transmembrane protein n=1 Tax=Schizopora paradoxa TaxID=27342 RepID=A0A0H2RK15_9AGAM|nr:hypothetical protein SCHPADRAFT_446262 [Schizopora paradoxa]